MTPIQTLGVLVYNRPDLLLRLFTSIDYPIDKIVLVQNNLSDIQLCRDVDMLERDQGITVHRSPVNLGCAAGWNWILKNHLRDWVVIVGNDIQLMPGDLAAVVENYERNKSDKNGAVVTSHGFNIMGITRAAVDHVGYFDENFYPIYYEDADWNWRYSRAEKQGLLTHADVCNLKAIHGVSCTEQALDEGAKAKYHKATERNHEYYIRKWGGGHCKEVFDTPFNDPTKTIKDWTLEPGRWALNAL